MNENHASDTALVSMRDIVMAFGPVKALRGADFELLPGEVHGLLGQNGAGKSTLIKILAGVYRPRAGVMEIGGAPTTFNSPAESQRAGIAVVHQSLSLVPQLTVAQNLSLGVEPLKAFGRVDNRAVVRKAEAVIEHYRLPLNPDQKVGSLTFAYRQLLEIAKALAKDARILILDEPTSSLSRAEEDILFGAIREAQGHGIGVIYVSHRLGEVMEITDRVTVFRDGDDVGSFNTSEIDIPILVQAIVGDKQQGLASSMERRERRAIAAGTTPVLSVSGLSNAQSHDVSLDVHAGEILGLVGTTGSGRTELLESLFGIRAITSGNVLVEGRPVHFRSPRAAIASGIKLIPEDRHEQGLVMGHTIEANSSLPNLGQLSGTLGRFRIGPARGIARHTIEELKVVANGIETKVENLSGGNQQKVLIGKWLDTPTKILLLDEPTAGVDVGARADIYRIINDLALNGTAVIVSSSDYEELLNLCTRFAFIRSGRVVSSCARDEVSSEKELHTRLESTREETIDV